MTMRKLVRIVEGISGISVPSFEEYVTDDLIDEMINTGKFVNHGGDLEDQWDNGNFDYIAERLHPEIIGLSYQEIHKTPEFRKILRAAVTRMAKDQYDNLVNGSKFDQLPPLSAETKLYRCIPGYLKQNQNLGVYWSQKRSQALRFIGNAGGILLVAEVKNVQIDWYETIRSRLDMSNGMDEAEIQLIRNSHVMANVYNVEQNRNYPKFEFIKDILGKA